MIIKSIKGLIANSNVEDFDNRSINEVLNHVVHLSNAKCAKVIEKVLGNGFVYNTFITVDDVAKALNLNKNQVYRALLTRNGGNIIRNHMVNVPNRVNLFTPRSIMILCVINRRFSNACRDISNEGFRLCRFDAKGVKDTKAIKAEVLPVPVEAKVQAPDTIPVEAHVMQDAVKVPETNEISLVIKPGMIMRVVAAF